MSNESFLLADKIKILLAFFKEAENIQFDGQRYTVPNDKEALLKKYTIPYEEFGNVLQLKLKSFIETNQTVKYYELLTTELKSNDINEDILLIDASGTIVHYIAKKNEFVTLGKENKKTHKDFKNLVAYFKLFNFFKSTDFCDYFNDANEEIVLYNSAKGIFKIKYTTIPLIDKTDSLPEKVDLLIQIATPVELHTFLKNAFFTFSNNTGILSIQDILAKAYNIIETTKRDYELVSKQFNFEKFRDALDKEKEKYFTNIREILNKLFSQAVGIPLSISATVLASNKVSNDRTILLIVLLSFLVYVAFYLSIQWIYKSDLKEIKIDFENDFATIQSKSGLPNAIIEKEKNKIKRRISHSLHIVRFLIGIVACLGLLVSWYILHELSKL